MQIDTENEAGPDFQMVSQDHDIALDTHTHGIYIYMQTRINRR
jgi:hypothetical protein